MNEMVMQENLDKLVNTISLIKHSGEENDRLVKVDSYISDLKNVLNTIFENYNCTDILYTLNTDNSYFGVIVNPKIDGLTGFKIFATEEPVELKDYQLELDSKLIDSFLTSEEVASIILFDISSTMCPGQIETVRSLVDLQLLADENDVINLRESASYTQLIVYAIKDTLYKVSSILFKDDLEDILANPLIREYHLEDAITFGQEKILSSTFGASDTLRSPETAVLQWVLMIYQDVKGYAASAIATLKDAKSFTASRLLIAEIDKVINAIDRAGNFVVKESTVNINNISLNKFFESKALYSLNELGLFKSLKLAGLRSIEDDYYELAVQVKALDTESDALYVLRAINSRLSILEDYIYNNEIKESDKKHWLAVAKQYRDLRNAVLNKKINKRKYSDIFMDYNDFESDND